MQYLSKYDNRGVSSYFPLFTAPEKNSGAIIKTKKMVNKYVGINEYLLAEFNGGEHLAAKRAEIPGTSEYLGDFMLYADYGARGLGGRGRDIKLYLYLLMFRKRQLGKWADNPVFVNTQYSLSHILSPPNEIYHNLDICKGVERLGGKVHFSVFAASPKKKKLGHCFCRSVEGKLMSLSAKWYVNLIVDIKKTTKEIHMSFFMKLRKRIIKALPIEAIEIRTYKTGNLYLKGLGFVSLNLSCHKYSLTIIGANETSVVVEFASLKRPGHKEWKMLSGQGIDKNVACRWGIAAIEEEKNRLTFYPNNNKHQAILFTLTPAYRKSRELRKETSPPARLAASASASQRRDGKPRAGEAGSPLEEIETLPSLNGQSSLQTQKGITSSPAGGSAEQLSKDDKWENVINSIRNLDTEMKLGVGYAFNETIHYRVQNIASFFDISYQGASQALFELIYDSKPFHEISLRKFAQRFASLSDDDISDRLIGITREIRTEEKAAVGQGLVPGTIKMYAFEKLADETIKILRYLGLRNPALRALSRRPDEKEKYLAFNVPIFVSAKLVNKFFHELFAAHLLPEPPQDRAYEYQASFGFYDDTKDFQTGLISLALLAISSDTNPLALPAFSPKRKLESYSLFHDFMPTSFFTSVQVAGKGLDFNGSKHDYAFSEKNSGERLSVAELEKKRADTTNIVRFSGPYLIDKWGTELKYLTIYPEYLRHFQPNETMGKRSDFYLIDNLEHIQIIQKLLLVFKKHPLLWQGFVKNMTDHLRGVRINIFNRQDDILSHLQNEPLKEYWRAAQMCPQSFYAFKDKNIHTNYYKLTTDREKIIFNPKGLKAYGALCQLVDQLKGHFKSNDRQRILLQECFYQTLEQIDKAKKQKKISIETTPFFPGSQHIGETSNPLGRDMPILESNYFTISRILERNLINTSKLERTLRPKSPETALWGGKVRQAASIFLISNPNRLILGMVTTGTYSSPLAVIISIILLGRAGLQPIANAISEGMVVRLAPVSMTILRIFELRLPWKRTLTTIICGFASIGRLAISKQKSYRVTFWKSIFGVVNKGKAFVRNGFFVYFFPVAAMGDKTAFYRGSGGWVKFIHLDQKPFILKSIFNIFYSFIPHALNPSLSNLSITVIRNNVNKVKKTQFICISSPLGGRGAGCCVRTGVRTEEKGGWSNFMEALGFKAEGVCPAVNEIYVRISWAKMAVLFSNFRLIFCRGPP